MNLRSQPKHTILSPAAWVSRATGGIAILALFSLVLGWFVLAARDQGQNWIWWSGLAWITPVLLTWLALRLGLLHIERAAHFYLLAAALFTLAILPLVDAAFRLFSEGIGETVWPVAVLIAAGVVILIWLRLSVTAKRLSLTEQNNISSKRLDPVEATWNVNALLLLNQSGPRDQQRSQGMQSLAAIAAAIILYVLRQVGALDSPITMGGIMLVLALTILVAVAGHHAGIAYQLMKWEQKWNKTICLTTGST